MSQRIRFVSVALLLLIATLMPAAAQRQPISAEGRLAIGGQNLGDSFADLVYTPLSPCRIIDTRVSGGVLTGGSSRDFLVKGTNGFETQGGTSGGCGVPTTATSVLLNFVAVTPDGLGNLKGSAYPNPIPTTGSILNYQLLNPTLNIANAVAFPVCDSSVNTCTFDITLLANGGGTHVVADVLGYFKRFPKEQTITSISAGAGLTGGGSSGDLVLGIANSGVGTGQIADGAVTDAKLTTITTAGKVANSATTATSANTANTIMLRDGSGNFSAGTITAALNGNATTATTADAATFASSANTAINFSGNLAGEVTGTQGATVVTSAVSSNTAGAIVRRDGLGGFAAGALTLSGKIDQTSIDGLVARGTFASGTIPATGGGTRMMWYPGKAAFRAGFVNGTQWDDASVGYYSTAMGNGTAASGAGSTAMGSVTTASGIVSTAMGDGTSASGSYSTAMGNGTAASGFASTAMGYATYASGDESTAMGWFASTTSGGTPRQGAFVYGDTSTTTLVTPTANNQFVVRAAGGTVFYSNSAMNLGVQLVADGTSWASVSDRSRKEDFRDINGEEILNKLAALPVTSWRYKNDDSGNRYIGPMAQDFHALFGLGTDKTIATLDVDGVTLAALKALLAEVERLKRRVEELEARHAAAP